MVAFAAAPPEPRLTQFLARPIIGANDVGQFMQAGLLAFAGAVPVVRADLDPALKGVSVADASSACYGYGDGVRWERSLEPVHLLDGMNIACAIPIAYYAIVLYQHCAG